jgi:hypothetical protein
MVITFQRHCRPGWVLTSREDREERPEEGGTALFGQYLGGADGSQASPDEVSRVTLNQR